MTSDVAYFDDTGIRGGVGSVRQQDKLQSSTRSEDDFSPGKGLILELVNSPMERQAMYGAQRFGESKNESECVAGTSDDMFHICVRPDCFGYRK